jgi:Domain of unknown function (DUF4403)
MGRLREPYRGEARSALWGCALIAVTSLSACQTPAPPMPVQSPPKPQLSYLNIPISIALAPVAAAIDKEVPQSAGAAPFELKLNGGAEPPSCGIDAGYAVARAPLAMSGSGDAIRTDLALAYWVKGRKQIPCPGDYTIASCGTDGEETRSVKASIDTAITLLPDLTASVHSTPGPIVPGNRCVLNPVGLDVTDTLMAGFANGLKPVLATLDQRLAKELQLRQRVEAGWARMNEPAELRPGIWLAMNPEGIGVVPISVENETLRTGIQLRLRPVVGAGTRPEAGTRPLPDADVAAPADTFEMQIPVEVEQSFVQARLDQALDVKGGGTPVSVGNYSVHVTSADVYGQGTQVVVKLLFKGDVNGTAYLRGTPYYDAVTRTLSFPDLDYTLETDRALLNSANWVAQNQIRERLRTRFTIEMTRPIEEMKQSLENVLNRQRGNVTLHGDVQALRLVGVYRLQDGNVFTAYLAATGKIWAEVDVQQ